MANFRSIGIKISQSPSVQKILADNFVNRAEEAKNATLQEFDNHPITQELQAGEHADNSSGTLPGLSDHGGNLFSFIGFNAGDDPTGVVREILEEYIRPYRTPTKKQVYSNGDIKFSFRVRVPELGDFEKDTKYPDGWQDGSWLYGIEHGIFGLSYYIYDEEFDTYEQSRSTSGLEAKRKDGTLITVRGSSQSKPSKYISEILRNFVKNLKAS